jgi:hypothetical protein
MNQLPTFGLRLIDVNEHSILDADIKERYIALSYVWGNAPQLRLLRSNVDPLIILH